MARLGYLFLVAALGLTIVGPSLAEAGERDGSRHYSGKHVDKPTKHAPIRYWDDRKLGHHPRHLKHRGHHPRYWKKRHHAYRPPVRRHYYGPPVVRHHRHDHRLYRPYGYYSNDLGSIDFNINYRLLF